MTLRDLQYRTRRLLVVVLGTGVVFALLLLMTGLAQQFQREPETTVNGFGAARWIVPAGATGAFTSAATIDESVAAELTGTPRADPLVVARHAMVLPSELMDVVIAGFVDGGLGEPRVTKGDGVSDGAVVVDDTAGVAVGETLRIGSKSFTVAGLTRDESLFAGMPMVFMTLRDAQDLVYKGAPRVTAVLTDRVPTSLPEGVSALTPAQVINDARRPLENAISSIDLIRMLLWGVSALIIGGMVFLSAMERRRDFAVMKAAGASTRWILGGVAIQGVLIALAAAVLALGLQALLAPVFPMKVRITAATMIQLPVVAVIVALLAGGGGLRQVARIDPAAAFGGPGA